MKEKKCYATFATLNDIILDWELSKFTASLLRVRAHKGFLRWIENSYNTKNNISHNT